MRLGVLDEDPQAGADEAGRPVGMPAGPAPVDEVAEDRHAGQPVPECGGVEGQLAGEPGEGGEAVDTGTALPGALVVQVGHHAADLRQGAGARGGRTTTPAPIEAVIDPPSSPVTVPGVPPMVTVPEDGARSSPATVPVRVAVAGVAAASCRAMVPA